MEMRSRETLPLMAVFGLITLVVFTFTFDLRTGNAALLAPGTLWVAFFFAGLLGLGRSFAREVERGSLEGLRATPVDPGALYLAKVLGNLLFVTLLQAVLLPLITILFAVPVTYLPLATILPLGALGFSAVGTTLAAMAVHTRAREALLPILLLPILVPVIIATVRGTALALDGAGWAQIAPWANLLLGFDVLYLTLSFLTFHLVIEE